MKRYIRFNANSRTNASSVCSVKFPSNMSYLAIMTPDYETVWEGVAYSAADIPSEYCRLPVIDKYRAGDPDDPEFGESYVVIVNK